MKLTIITDKKVYKYKDKYYTTGGFLFQVESFLDKFDTLIIATNIEQVIKLDPSYLEFKGNYDFINLKVNIKNKILQLKYIVNNSDSIQLRLPSKNGLLIGLMLKRSTKSLDIRAYIGGHPIKGILMTKKSNIKNIFFSKVNGYLTNKVVKKYQTFVTGKELFDYFYSHDIKTIQIISTSIKDIDIVKNSKKLLSNNEVNILYVGRLSHEKGIDSLSKYFGDRQLSKLTLNIVGEGPLKETIINYANKYPNIRYHGGIYERQRLFDLMEKMHIFLLPSLSEGTPKVILEAMAKGIPVIATNVGGIPSMVNHNINGLLFEPENYKEMEKHLLNLSSNSDQYQKFSEEGIIFAKRNSLEELNKKLVGDILSEDITYNN